MKIKNRVMAHGKKPKNPRFEIRETLESLNELDEALLKLGYINNHGQADRAAWYRECKREIIKKSKEIEKNT